MSKKEVFGTKEWAEVNANIERGCPNACWYCYARANCARYGQKDPSTWATPEPDDKSVQKLLRKQTPKKVMFPTQHDITLNNLERCIEAIHGILNAGHQLLIVSKPKLGCIAQICNDCAGYRDKILFRFTIGAGDNDPLAMWEPGAPCFEERMAALKLAYHYGFATSVSCEPLLVSDVSSVLSMVNNFFPFVTDAVWIGRMNYPDQRLSMNGAPDELIEKAKHLTEAHSDEFFLRLHRFLAGHPKIKWKESVKRVLGMEVPTTAGMDV